MSQLCRACLVARDSFKYTLFENVSADVYSFCTSVEVTPDDKLPKTLCDTCHELLENYTNFKRTCIQAQNTLVFQNNMKLPNEGNLLNNVKCEIDESFEVVVSMIKVDNDAENGYNEDADNVYEDFHTGQKDYNDWDNTAKIEDVCHYEAPLEELEKKIKCTIRKVQRKEPKTKNKKKTKVFEYVCELCKRKFKYKDRYEAHRLEHEGQTINKTCTVCKKVFKTWSGLQRHTDSEHKVVKLTNLCCKSCGKVFKNQQTLKLHSKLHEQPEDNTLVCDICGKSYSTAVTLKLHLESHNENRPRDFPCEHCGKKFFTKYILQAHIKRLHSGQRFICHICNYPFTDKYNLGKHVLQKHQGIRKDKCDICNKFFSTHSTLVIHKRIHSGERPFGCTYCIKAFSSKHRLLVHHRTHTGERPHRCLVCNVGFTQLGSMRRHMKSHAKVVPPLNKTEGYHFEKPVDGLL